MEGLVTSEQRAELLGALKRERRRRYADRIRVILLLDEGIPYQSIAKIFFLDEGTIANYRRRYVAHGLEDLTNDAYLGRRSMVTEDEEHTLEADLRKTIFPHTKAVIAHREQKYGIQYTRGGATALLHRLGFSFKKPKGVPGKAQRAKQVQFIREYTDLSPTGD